MNEGQRAAIGKGGFGLGGFLQREAMRGAFGAERADGTGQNPVVLGPKIA